MQKLMSLVLILILCSCVPQKRVVAEDVQYFGTKRLVGHFANLDIRGPFNINLTTGAKYAKVLVKADERALPDIELEIKNNTLYVRCMKNCAKYHGSSLRIEVKNLNNFYYSGSGRITGHKVNLRQTNLHIINHGATRLSGNLNLRDVYIAGKGYTSLTGVKAKALSITLRQNARLQVRGEVQLASLTLGNGTWLSLYWLKANQLEFKGRGRTFVQLAGIVRVLDIELWGHARFNGRYLRAQETFIKTHGHSLAEISTFGHQHTLALDSSDIYYYNDYMKSHADFMGMRGAVLDLNEWEPADLDDNLYSDIQSTG